MVADVSFVDVVALGQSDLEHGDDSAELELIKSFEEWLVFVNNGDVADLVDLVETLDSVLDQLGEVDCRLDCVGHSLDDDGVVGILSAVEQLPCSLEISSDSNSSSNSDFVSWKLIFGLIDSSIRFCHLVK